MNDHAKSFLAVIVFLVAGLIVGGLFIGSRLHTETQEDKLNKLARIYKLPTDLLGLAMINKYHEWCGDQSTPTEKLLFKTRQLDFTAKEQAEAKQGVDYVVGIQWATKEAFCSDNKGKFK
jgi:hypothetical protein